MDVCKTQNLDKDSHDYQNFSCSLPQYVALIPPPNENVLIMYILGTILAGGAKSECSVCNKIIWWELFDGGTTNTDCLMSELTVFSISL